MSAERNRKLPPWRTLEQTEIYSTRIFELDSVIRREDQTGNEGEFYVLRANDWINVVAVTSDAQLILVDQFRHGTDGFELEIVGGIMNPGESPIEAALRELKEETGYGPTAASIVEVIGMVLPNPAFLDNRCYTILVTDAELLSKQEFDDHENIEVVLEPLGTMNELVRSGRITHGLVINAFYWYERWALQRG